MTTIKTNSLAAWILAARPKTLGAICCPVLVGSAFAFAHNKFSVAIFLVALLCSILLQILANVVNDYGDYIKGADGVDRLGPPRAMQMGLITKGAMHQGIAIILLAIAILGLTLVAWCGLWVLGVGLASAIVALWYTTGSKPLAYIGFAEVAVLIFFGPLPVIGAYFLQTSELAPGVLVASLSPAFLATALILTNNLRDINQDRANNKRTVAVRFGEKVSRFFIITFVLASALPPLFLVSAYGYSYLLLLSSLALLLPLTKFKLVLSEPVSARFNLMLAAIGKSLYLFGIAMSLGVIYGAP